MAVSAVSVPVHIVKLEMDCPFEADPGDVRPVEQNVGERCDAEKDQRGEDGEEGGQVGAEGGLRKCDVEWLANDFLSRISGPSILSLVRQPVLLPML